jgi:hypothetical protein
VPRGNSVRLQNQQDTPRLRNIVIWILLHRRLGEAETILEPKQLLRTTALPASAFSRSVSSGSAARCVVLPCAFRVPQLSTLPPLPPFSPFALKHRERQTGCALRHGGFCFTSAPEWVLVPPASRAPAKKADLGSWEQPPARALRVVCLERLRAKEKLAMFDNVVRLIGFVGSDAELKTTKAQREFTVLSLATTAS